MTFARQRDRIGPFCWHVNNVPQLITSRSADKLTRHEHFLIKNGIIPLIGFSA